MIAPVVLVKISVVPGNGSLRLSARRPSDGRLLSNQSRGSEDRRRTADAGSEVERACWSSIERSLVLSAVRATIRQTSSSSYSSSPPLPPASSSRSQMPLQSGDRRTIRCSLNASPFDLCFPLAFLLFSLSQCPLVNLCDRVLDIWRTQLPQFLPALHGACRVVFDVADSRCLRAARANRDLSVLRYERSVRCAMMTSTRREGRASRGFSLFRLSLSLSLSRSPFFGL